MVNKSKYSREDYNGLRGFHASRASLDSSIMAQWEQGADAYLDSLYGTFDQPIGDITSRDQIINPYDVVDASQYAMTRRGQSLYNQHLEQAKLISQQQEAKYQEWYESPEQVVARERAAGRNPDLIDPIASEAGSVEMPTNGAFDNIPTNGEIVLNSLSSIANVFSSVAGIMGTISSIDVAQAQKSLIKNQADGQFIDNLISFSSSSSSVISDRLAKAMESEDFDMESFFAGDFSDVLTSLSPSADPRYKMAFDRILNHSKKTHSDAYASLSDYEDRRLRYLEKISSGYYSEDDDEMVGQLSYVVQADEELHRITTQLSKDIADIKSKYISNVDVEGAADAFDAQNEYNTEYYSAMDGELMSAIVQAAATYDTVVKRTTSDVYAYLGRKFNSPIMKLLPSVRSRIGFEILAGAHMGWQDHMYSVGNSAFQTIINEIVSQTSLNNSSSDAVTRNAATNERNAATNERNADTQRTAMWLNFAANLFSTAASNTVSYMNHPH